VNAEIYYTYTHKQHRHSHREHTILSDEWLNTYKDLDYRKIKLYKVHDAADNKILFVKKRRSNVEAVAL